MSDHYEQYSLIHTYIHPSFKVNWYDFDLLQVLIYKLKSYWFACMSQLLAKCIHLQIYKANISLIHFYFCSYLHRISRMKFLTCEPNLSGIEDYIDEANIFYQDPAKWLNETYMERPWPSHLVYFSLLSENITTQLESHAYHECGRFFHTHLPEGRVGTHVVVSCK